MTVSAAMVFGLISLMFLDTSSNMAMQPFKMMAVSYTHLLQARMRELAYLNKGITISLTDRRIKEEDGSFKKEIFHSDEGIH